MTSGTGAGASCGGKSTGVTGTSTTTHLFQHMVFPWGWHTEARAVAAPIKARANERIVSFERVLLVE
jgi:hypothetical protein